MTLTAEQKHACAACGAQAEWNPAKGMLVCSFCGTEAPFVVDPNTGALVEHDLVKALREMPEMNNGFDVIDGKPTLIQPAHINLGLAIDLAKPDGTRQLLVPSIKAAETMDFAAFWTAYEELIRKARNNKLEVSDFQGTTISLTNPGTIVARPTD